MSNAIPRLSACDSVLVVVDVQDKLLAKVPEAVELTGAVELLLAVADAVGVPVIATEQYPKGLGPTAATVAKLFPATPLPKTAFGCWQAAGFVEQLAAGGCRTVVLCGLETHVCVAQTALDLLAHGYRVFVSVDAVASRFPLDHATALRRLERAGAVLTTAEAVAFEWVEDAAHPQFKVVSRLVIDRRRT